MQAQINDIRVYYQQHGEGLPVILLHGFPLDHTIWEPTVTAMRSEAQVITPDLRGFGLSDAPQGAYTMRQMADDLAGLMDALKQSKAVIVGHSMGGYITLAFAQAYPERLAGIGFISSQSVADSPERRAARYAQAEDTLLHGPRALADGQTPKLSADHQYHAEIHRIILRNKPSGLAGALKAMAERSDTSALLPTITVPGLVIAGLDDQLIPVERSRELAQALPHAELVEIPGAGHMPMMEKPDQVAAALDKLVLEINSQE